MTYYIVNTNEDDVFSTPQLKIYNLWILHTQHYPEVYYSHLLHTSVRQSVKNQINNNSTSALSSSCN